MDDILEILSDVCPEVDFAHETHLIDDSVLDSFDIITIVSELNEAFDIEIDVEDLEPENFNSAEAIYQLVTRLQG